MAKLREVGPGGVPEFSMPFIVTSSTEKVDPATRRLIRSHVMRGKKQKQHRAEKDGRMTRMSASSRTQVLRVRFEDVSVMYNPLIPDRVGSDLSFVDFADEMEASVLFNMTKVSKFAQTIMFPLIAAIGFQADNKEWLHLVTIDAAALHITAFAVEEFIDKVLRSHHDGTNLGAMLHFQKGLELLRKRLLGQDDETKVTDSTIGVVMKLASAAHFNGDFDTSMQHMEGIRRMVDLRGGLEVFKGTQLLVDMLRCDLGLALLNVSDHVFYRQPSEPVIGYPETVLTAAKDKMRCQVYAEPIKNMNNELATAWQVMVNFCLLVNLGTQTQRLVRPEIVYETMTALLYRLLDMNFPANSIDEAVRQGLLAFSYHVFLQWQDIRPPYRRFPLMYKRCLLGLQVIDGVSPSLALWLLMAGAISFFDISNEKWLMEELRRCVQVCQLKTWKDMREIMKTYMWIALLDDELGEDIYNAIVLES